MRAPLSAFKPAAPQETTINGVGGLYASTTVGNPNISPERVSELEAGLDLSLFQGKADLSITRYDSKSKDVIFGVALAPSTGSTNINLNAGQISNKGWELTSGVRVLQRGNLSIELSGNWAENRNLVT